jgi:hypothetical protein
MPDRITRPDNRRQRGPTPHPRDWYEQARTQELGMFGQAADVLPYNHPAYERTWDTRTVTFQCAHCGETVTQERYPGPTPTYCGQECYEAATAARRREQTRERVRRLRERRRNGTNGDSLP